MLETVDFQPIWAERYRPQTIDECILPSKINDTLKNFLKQGDAIHLIFHGPPGCGKTAAAQALLREMGSDYKYINGSLHGSIDTLRTEIQAFASTVSFFGGRKYVILDEADGLSPAIQRGLRGFMEEYSQNCGFILTCNYRNKIIPAISESRCADISFSFTKKELIPLVQRFVLRAMQILSKENIPFDKKVLTVLVAKNAPDWRRTLNMLQRWATTYGSIGEDVLANLTNLEYTSLIGSIKLKDFATARKWIGENSDDLDENLFSKLYANAYDIVESASIPDFIVILAKYQYQMSQVANPEIQVAEMILEIMASVIFK